MKKFFLFFPDMSQFGLSTGNAHWGYSAATPYTSYLGSGALSSCGTGSFNPSLGFATSGEQTPVGHEGFGSSTAVSSREYKLYLCLCRVRTRGKILGERER